MEVITYEIQQQVRVRKYNVDCKKLCDLLRKHKKMASLRNKEIAETLNMPITKVEHWFRQDSCFSIPDECIWFELKKLLKITNNEFDLAITTFEEKDNVFEKGNRIYDSQGICPTITCLDSLVVLDRSYEMEVMKLFDIPKEVINDNERQRRVYSVEGISPTVLSRSDNAKIMEVIRLGNLYGEDRGTGFAGNVWDKSGVCPTITTMQGGGREPMIIDDTYAKRQPRVYKDYSPALRSERGGLKTIETISTKSKQIEVASTILAGYERTNMTGFNADNGVVETVRIKQATSQGYIECEVGGVADLSFPDSNTRRGRVQDKGQVSPTLMAGETDICRIEKEVINPLKGLSENGWHFEQNVYDANGLVRSVKSESGSGNIPKVIEKYRIRKLTPKECWRLMDFTDDDFEKAAQVNSNTQLYKQAGNSIIRNVLVAILGQLIEGKEDAYRKV